MSNDGREKNIVSVCPRMYSLTQLWTNNTAVTLHQNMLRILMTFTLISHTIYLQNLTP